MDSRPSEDDEEPNNAEPLPIELTEEWNRTKADLQQYIDPIHPMLQRSYESSKVILMNLFSVLCKLVYLTTHSSKVNDNDKRPLKEMALNWCFCMKFCVEKAILGYWKVEVTCPYVY